MEFFKINIIIPILVSSLVTTSFAAETEPIPINPELVEAITDSISERGVFNEKGNDPVPEGYIDPVTGALEEGAQPVNVIGTYGSRTYVFVARTMGGAFVILRGSSYAGQRLTSKIRRKLMKKSAKSVAELQNVFNIDTDGDGDVDADDITRKMRSRAYRSAGKQMLIAGALLLDDMFSASFGFMIGCFGSDHQRLRDLNRNNITLERTSQAVGAGICRATNSVFGLSVAMLEGIWSESIEWSARKLEKLSRREREKYEALRTVAYRVTGSNNTENPRVRKAVRLFAGAVLNLLAQGTRIAGMGVDAMVLAPVRGGFAARHISRVMTGEAGPDEARDSFPQISFTSSIIKARNVENEKRNLAPIPEIQYAAASNAGVELMTEIQAIQKENEQLATEEKWLPVPTIGDIGSEIAEVAEEQGVQVSSIPVHAPSPNDAPAPKVYMDPTTGELFENFELDVPTESSRVTQEDVAAEQRAAAEQTIHDVRTMLGGE